MVYPVDDSHMHYNVRDVLLRRLRHYMISREEKERIAYKAILAAASDPDLIDGPQMEASLHCLLHQITQEGLICEKRSAVSRNVAE